MITQKGINLVEFTAQNEQRLDIVLSENLKISRNQASNLIKKSLVKINNQTAQKASSKIQTNDKISVEFAEPKEIKNKFKANFDVPIIYEDDDILVINKPANIVTHGASSLKEASLVEWLNENNFMLSNLNGDVRAGIVHRLDRGTSGAMVVAKNNKTHAKLSEQLSDKTMGRIYIALCDLPLKENCIIEKNIGRNPQNRLKQAIVKNGRYAKSAFLNIYQAEGVNLIAVKLFTGRTHQIRVHLSSINRHILGDYLYGFKSEKGKINRVMLHAYLLYFIHPISGQRVEFQAPIYDDFTQIALSKFQKEIFDEKIQASYINDSFSRIDDWLWIK